MSKKYFRKTLRVCFQDSQKKEGYIFRTLFAFFFVLEKKVYEITFTSRTVHLCVHEACMVFFPLKFHLLSLSKKTHRVRLQSLGNTLLPTLLFSFCVLCRNKKKKNDRYNTLLSPCPGICSRSRVYFYSFFCVMYCEPFASAGELCTKKRTFSKNPPPPQ